MSSNPNHDVLLWYFRKQFVTRLRFSFSKIVGDRGHRPAVSAGSDLGLWPHVRQREHGGHGLPVHHLQLPPGNVHLHFPLRAAEEGRNT